LAHHDVAARHFRAEERLQCAMFLLISQCAGRDSRGYEKYQNQLLIEELGRSVTGCGNSCSDQLALKVLSLPFNVEQRWRYADRVHRNHTWLGLRNKCKNVEQEQSKIAICEHHQPSLPQRPHQFPVCDWIIPNERAAPDHGAIPLTLYGRASIGGAYQP